MNQLVVSFDEETIDFRIDGDIPLANFLQVAEWVIGTSVRWVLKMDEATTEDVANVISNISAILPVLYNDIMADESFTEQQKTMLNDAIIMVQNKIKELQDEAKQEQDAC